MRPGELNFLFSSLTALPGIGSILDKAFKRLGCAKILDVLYHFPVQVIHRPVITNEKDLIPGQYATICLTITQYLPPARKKMPFQIQGLMNGQIITLNFFHGGAFLEKQYPLNQNIWVSGQISVYQGRTIISHPDYTALNVADIPVYEPVYPLTQGLTSKTIAKAVKTILANLPSLPEWLSPDIIKDYHFPTWKQALKTLHHPQDITTSAYLSARRRLAYDELLANQLVLALTRQHQKQALGKALSFSGTLWLQCKEKLPFSLTGAQERIITEIQSDMTTPVRMNRLVQGDVGSGKTVVALAALLFAVESGGQGAFMAPTDTLARQHFATLTRLTNDLDIKIALITAREKGKAKTQVLQQLAQGEIDIVIGTHALITDNVCFHDLRLAVVDEQHKFGVQQRLHLARKGYKTDLLVMTATPIPRTLTLTLYGDMDVSLLDEKPKGRKSIQTSVLSVQKIPELMMKLKQQLNQDNPPQIYWVCPLVGESEKTDLTAAEQRFSSLQAVFGDKVGLVHGKMKGPEKDAVMEQFKAGTLSILVSTTVIEVGVDVPNATLMIIEHAERFGLAALHQLRGRIGRGERESQCLLLYGPKLSTVARQRLNIMRQTDNGFLIAEEDLRLRGSGDVLGVRQSGLPTFYLADIEQDKDLLIKATKEARQIVQNDILSTEQGKSLRMLLYLFSKDTAAACIHAG